MRILDFPAMPATSPLRTVLAVAALALALQPAASHAQGSNDGSLYSRFGIGELQTFATSQIEAMGGAGYALHSLNYLNVSNPATWADQVLTRAAAGFTYQNLRVTDAQDNQSRLASGFLNGVRFGLPILERKLGVAVGFVPYSRVSYRVQEEGTLYPENPEPDTVLYTVDYEGTGGLQQIIGGAGYRFNENFSAGFGVNVVFGIVENGRRTSFIEPGNVPQFVDANVRSATRLAGVTGTIGAFFSAPNLLREQDWASVGAAFTLPTTLYGRRVRTLGENLDQDTLGTTIDGDVRVPWRLGVGAAYYPDARWAITAGGKFEPWTDFDSDFSFPRYEPGDTEQLSDRIQLGAGVEFQPAGSDLLASYFERVGYRLGFSYDRSYISPEPDASIRTMAVTGGLSLPTMMSGTRLDINLQVGTRGSAEEELVRDFFYRLSANVNIGERWFQTPKLR